MLRVDDISINILKNISFELGEEENIIILGSNGAGKTTLAKAISNLIENNDIYFYDKSINGLSAKQRAQFLNYTPAKLEVFDEYLTLREFLELSLLNGNMKEDLDEVLKVLEIEHLDNSSCLSLSSGESQLALIASALLHNAKLTILDEPTSNLDQSKKVKIYNILKAKEMFGTKIIITHDLNIAYKLGYRILFLKEGRLEFDGSSEEFFNENNLKKFFGDSVKKVDDYYVVNIQ